MLYLETRSRNGAVRKALRQGDYLLGRSRACDLVVPDPSVSRRHLKLSVNGHATVLEDLGSRHGTWIDGARVVKAEIRTGEWFHVGVVPMVLREGISLQGDSSATGRPASSPPGSSPAAESVTVGATLQPQESDRVLGDDELVAEIAACLSGRQRHEQLLADLLRRLLQTSGAPAVLLTHRFQGSDVLIACSGDRGDVERIARSRGRDGLDASRTTALELPTGDGEALHLLLDASKRPDPGLVALIAATATRLIERERASARPEREVDPHEAAAADHGEFVAVSSTALAVLREIDRLAKTRLSVVLLGESGTGKELLARRLHDHSERAGGPFVPLNCAALPRELLDAELFGIEKGVATGVAGRPGWFVRASGGTLFLDEIGDLPLELQPKLLRVLETGEVLPLGARFPVQVDVRIVAASHRPLRVLAEEQRFRGDLLFRLSGAVVHVPPLRERPADVLPLAQRLARRAAREQGRRFDGIDLGAARLLVGYAWPGNVRELLHVVERAVALADGSILHEELLPPEILGRQQPEKGDLMLSLMGDWRSAREQFDRVYFSQLIKRCKGNLTEVSRIAGLARSNLYRRLKELGLR